MTELDKEDIWVFLTLQKPHINILPTSFERPYIVLFKLSISPKSVNKRFHNHHFKKSLLRTETSISYISEASSPLARLAKKRNHLNITAQIPHKPPPAVQVHFALKEDLSHKHRIYLRKDELRLTPIPQQLKKPPHQVNGIRIYSFHSTLGVQGKGFGQQPKVLKIAKKSSLNT